MKSPSTTPHALTALTHPAALTAAAVLLLNAVAWQRLWPSWWTGKIGDVAWLVIVPLLAAAALGMLGPLRRLSPRGFAAWVCLPIAVAFAAAKAIPGVNSALLALGASLGLSLKLRLDPTDLLALPGLLVSVWIWHKTPQRSAPLRGHGMLQAAALVLAALAVIADTAGPQDFGINCLSGDSTGYFAVHEIYLPAEIGSGKRTKTIYRSDDGGLTWVVDTQKDSAKFVCYANPVWPAPDPSDETASLYFVPRQGIYRSTDKGQNLQLEQPLGQAPDFRQDRATGNLIVAGGLEGIWVKTAAGEWQQTLALGGP